MQNKADTFYGLFQYFPVSPALLGHLSVHQTASLPFVMIEQSPNGVFARQKVMVKPREFGLKQLFSKSRK